MALVLFSGGQDSTTCLAWALERFERVETIGFDYGQRHRVELEQRAGVREALAGAEAGVGARLGEDHMLDFRPWARSATPRSTATRRSRWAPGLPYTFVPGRNLIFLTLAAALAYRRGLKRIVGGMCETDFSGYPDCRDDTMKAMQVALNIGMERRFVLETPLMWIDKAQTWALAQELGGDALVEAIVEHSHTCYLGERGAAPRLGLWLRRVPGLPSAGGGV